MATFLINLPPQDMQRRLPDALGVYVDAMRYRDTMRDRVEALGGSFRVTSEPGCGTSVCAVIPVEDIGRFSRPADR